MVGPNFPLSMSLFLQVEVCSVPTLSLYPMYKPWSHCQPNYRGVPSPCPVTLMFVLHWLLFLILANTRLE